MTYPHLTENCQKDIVIDKELGRGDFGIAYSTTDNKVLKVISINEKSTLDNFNNECTIGKVLGADGISPQIYDVWTCDENEKTSGFYTMQKLTGVWKNKYEHTLPKDVKGKSYQQQLITKLDSMVKSGYLHQDCHVGNIGFIDDKVVLFDFGLTITTGKVNSPICLEAMIISQLCIVIEQYSFTDKYSTDNLIHSRINDFWVHFPINLMRNPVNHLNVSIKEQDEIIDSFITWVGQNIEENDTVQKNMVLCFLYRYIDFLALHYKSITKKKDFSTDYYGETTNRFPSKVYDLIYNIRLNKFATLVEMAAGIPTLAPLVKTSTFEWNKVAFGGKRKRTKNKRKNKRTRRR
jgi:hypothetical protein